MRKTLQKTKIDESNEKERTDIIYTTKGIKENNPLSAESTKSFEIHVVWKVSVTSILGGVSH